MKFHRFISTLQAQECNFIFGDQPEVQLHDQLTAGVNHSAVQKELLLKQEFTFSEALAICEQPDDVSEVKAEHSVAHFQKTSPVLPVIHIGGSRSQLLRESQNKRPRR